MTNPNYVQREEMAGVPDQSLEKLPQLVMPSASIKFRDTAKVLFTGLAKCKRYFARGRLIVELAGPEPDAIDETQRELFQVLEPDALRSRVESVFRVYAGMPKGKVKWNLFRIA
jgi:hypothetical protein